MATSDKGATTLVGGTAKARGARGTVKRDLRRLQNVGGTQLNDTQYSMAPPGGPPEGFVSARKPLSAWDKEPNRWYPKDKRDERFDTLADLEQRGMLGQDKMLGQREYDGKFVDWIQDKRDQKVSARMIDLLGRAYDPLDPVQRRILDNLVPSFSRSKSELVDATLEQREFLMKMSHVAHLEDGDDRKLGKAMSSFDKAVRLIMIMGGGEQLLIHPLEEEILNNGILGSILGNAMKGLFSFSSWGKAGEAASFISATRGRRVGIGKMVIHHFPAFMQGRYAPLQDLTGKQVNIDAGSEKLVDLCEAIVKENVTVGRFLEQNMQTTGSLTSRIVKPELF